MRINFDHEIDNNPQPEEAGTITVTATIFGDDDEFDTPFTTRSHSIQDVFGCDEDEDSDCQIVRELKCFLLVEANIDDDDVIGDAMRKLVAYIDGVACFTSNSGYSLECALSVQMDLFPDSRSQIEEAIQVSFDETSNNTRFIPASKVVVKTLIRKVYKKKIEKENMNKKKKKKKISLEECTICLEEFKNGGRVVPLACGHEFDEECIVKWLETSHVCPLCRYELPCEDQMN
ncbi:E3 ubiquitin ligase BIG BROTHER-related-like [Brassica rapa]|uniref:RING-type E3 ubiquitin transferase n=1 Tax=Brassica campestris TaxID=3711 RepID=M4DQE0_BRACM|nr:E3 ubiquitin ligase BIG BROTHER-related-like [Brassica rapa]